MDDLPAFTSQKNLRPAFNGFLPQCAATAEARGRSPRTRSSFAACSPPGGRGEMVQCDSVVGLRGCLGAIQMVAMDFSDSVPAVTSSSHPLRSPGWMPGFRVEPELHEAGTA